MSASTEHPGRPLFDSNWSPGILSKLVNEEHERGVEGIPSPEEAKQIFRTGGVPAFADLVDVVLSETSRKLLEFGSGSIDLEQVTQRKFTIETALRLQELYIGDVRRNIRPITWLCYLARRFDDVPPELRLILERVISEMVRIQKSIAKHDGSAETSFDSFLSKIRFDKPFN